jgi:predicted GNAT family N-acyltransferase
VNNGSPPPAVNTQVISNNSPDVKLTTNVASLSANTAATLLSRYEDAGDMYWAGLANHGGSVFAEIWKEVGGVWTELASHQGVASGGILEFDTVGAALNLYLNGQRLASATDSTLTSGKVGTYVSGSSLLTSFLSSSSGAAASGPLSPTAQAQLGQMRESFGFYNTGNNYLGYLGLDEKWMKDRNGRWYIMTPDGQISRWNSGSSITPLANGQVDPQAWDNPNLLFQAPVTLTTPQSQLAQLRQTYGFRFAGDYYLNYLGLNEKWFIDRNNQWWVLTPKGQLQPWSAGTGLGSAVALLDPVVYDDPNTFLFQATVSSQLSELRHDFGFRTTGDYSTGYLGLNYKWILSRNNQWYVLTPLGQLEYWNGGSSFTLVDNVGTSVYRDPTQLFTAPVSLTTQAQSQLHLLNQKYGFQASSSYQGVGYVWFLDSNNQWWALAPGGQLQQWSDTAGLLTPIATIDPLVYDNPLLLFTA